MKGLAIYYWEDNSWTPNSRTRDNPIPLLDLSQLPRPEFHVGQVVRYKVGRYTYEGPIRDYHLMVTFDSPKPREDWTNADITETVLRYGPTYLGHSAGWFKAEDLTLV